MYSGSRITNGKSFILLDDAEQQRHIFCVRSFGYGNLTFTDFYRKLRWMVPGQVRIIGTRKQKVWNMRKSMPGSALLPVWY